MAYTFEDLYKQVSEYRGTGRDPDGDDLTIAKERVHSGYNAFLADHKWQFLNKINTQDTTADQWYIDLPDDFRELTSDISYSSGSGIRHLEESDLTTLMRLRSFNNGSGQPFLYALGADYDATADPVAKVQWKMYLYYTPGSTYTLSYEYKIDPPSLEATGDIPAGGGMHDQTIRAYCLAEVENFDDEREGVWTNRKRIELAKSIAIDKRMAARSVGQMRPTEGEDAPMFDRTLGDVTYS